MHQGLTGRGLYAKIPPMQKLLITILCVMLWASAEARAEDAASFSFGLIADVQYADQDAIETAHYRASPQKLNDALKRFNQENLDFVIHLGDFIDRGFESFETVNPLWETLKVPAYHVLGNHDYDVADDKKALVAEALNLNEKYYSFTRQGWKFIALDGNDISLYAQPMSDPAYQNAKAYFEKIQSKNLPQALPVNGAVGSDQLNWLNGQLSTACADNQKAVVFSHFPVYPQHRLNLWNAEELMQILESHSCTFAYVSGHNHEGNYAVKNGIHYLTLQGVLLTPDKNAFAIARVYQNKIDIQGFGREENRTLHQNAADTAAESSQPAETRAEIKQNSKEIALADSSAYEQYKRRPASELSKLILLMNYYKERGVSVVYDNLAYEADVAFKHGRNFLARNYNKENAAAWIKKYAYRSNPGGNIIFLQFSDNERYPLRDLLLERLEELDSL